jgi:ring-1,2-phenylacetyl-CoA epoxidase subunit PaaA
LPASSRTPQAAQPPSAKDADYQAEFDARLARGEVIEPKDWMPDAYRKTLVRPDLAACTFRNRRHAARRQLDHARAHAQTQGDPAGQGSGRRRAWHVPVRRAETLGVSRDELVEALHAGRAKYSSIFNYPTLSWADVGVIGWLVDGAHHEPDSAVPLLVRSLRPCDGAHLQGRELPSAPGLRSAADHDGGTRAQREMVQDAVNRWWWPSLMMFGPHDSQSQHSEQSMKWGIKRISNDELRQKFIDATVPQAHLLGVTLPDPDLKLNEANGHYQHGAIDWDEFWNVVNGHGQCNHERLAERVKAWEDGAWVREAALAHAAKHADASG